MLKKQLFCLYVSIYREGYIKMDSKNICLFENANAHRVHADMIRWMLMAAFFTLFEVVKSLKTENLLIYWLISLLFLCAIMVQQWYYNVYALYVKNCEDHIIKKIDLLTLHQFEERFGWIVKLTHSSFLIMLIIAALCCSELLSIYLGYRNPIIYILHISLVLSASYWWNTIVYKQVILRLSNLCDRNHNIIQKISEQTEEYLEAIFDKNEIERYYKYDEVLHIYYLKKDLTTDDIRILVKKAIK